MFVAIISTNTNYATIKQSVLTINTFLANQTTIRVGDLASPAIIISSLIAVNHRRLHLPPTFTLEKNFYVKFIFKLKFESAFYNVGSKMESGVGVGLLNGPETFFRQKYCHQLKI